MKHIKNTLSCLAMAALAFAAPQAAAMEPLNVGFVYLTPIGDAGWTFQHDLGRKAVEAKYGKRVKVSFVESVPEGADSARVISNLAQKGNDLIFTTSFGYMEPTLKAAKRFPKVIFEHATGYKSAKNMGNYLPRFYEGRYLGGMVAGAKTKTNVIGYIGAFPIPEVVRGINSFMRGAQRENPDAKIKVIWINSWYDPGKEREASEALLAQGADVITHHTDSPAAVQAAQEKGKFAVAYHSDMKKFGPKAQLAAVVHNWDEFYIRRVGEALDGKWKTSSVWEGIDKGMVDIIINDDIVDSALAGRVKKARDDIAAGRLHPFAGPVVKQDGSEAVAAGANLSDKDMQGMDYYVRGVEGKLPQ
jgi:simple sugar transport system substrate-binding protein